MDHNEAGWLLFAIIAIGGLILVRCIYLNREWRKQYDRDDNQP